MTITYRSLRNIDYDALALLLNEADLADGRAQNQTGEEIREDFESHPVDLANHTLADLLLFGGFLLWAVLCFRAARARDRAAGVTYPVGTLQGNALTLAVGLAAWALLAFGLHGWLFGVRPFG